MKIILTKDVPALGRKHDTKTVADGYARNFLLPRSLAVAATDALIKDAERKKVALAASQDTDIKTIQELAKKLDGYKLEIPVEASEGGTLYAAIGIEELKAAFAKKKMDIGNAILTGGESLKEIGEHTVTLRYPHGLETKILVSLTRKEKKRVVEKMAKKPKTKKPAM